MRQLTLGCGTTLTFDQLEAARLSFVPCGQVDGNDQPLLPYSHLWDIERQVTRASYGKKWYGYGRRKNTTGVQLMTGKPSFRDTDGRREYLTDIDIEARLLQRYPEHADRILKIYRDGCHGTPCVIRTKSDGRRLTGFSPWYDTKRAFTDKTFDGEDDTQTMLLEFFSLKGLSRLDTRYAILEGALLEIPSLPKTAYQEIHAVISEIATENHAQQRNRNLVDASAIDDDLKVVYDKNGVSDDFSNVYCQAGIRDHDSGRATVRFFKNPDGSEIGHCAGCNGSWIRKKACQKPQQRAPLPPLQEVLQREDQAVQSLIANAPVLETPPQPSVKYFSQEEKIVIRHFLNEDPNAGWIPAGEKNIPAWVLKYNQLHPATGEFALNGQPAEVEKRRAWHTQFSRCPECGGIAAKWVNRYHLTTGIYCNDCHKDFPLGSYLEYELNRKLPNSIITTSDAKYLGDDPEYADFRLLEPGTLTYLAAAMGTGKTTEIGKLLRMLSDQGLGKGIIAVPRISLARFLGHYLRDIDGLDAWGLWHEGSGKENKFIGEIGAICCLPSLPAVTKAAEGTTLNIAIDEIDFSYSLLSLTINQATQIKKNTAGSHQKDRAYYSRTNRVHARTRSVC